ncbi:PrsW family intramembrane metalloprotease [Acidipropionibacterium jensenii]|uniref:PrsW family intramembrane metalloprotease n=1 Tax=Acidipropionibacterium jensenii TaxID=1749 RepID=UPI00110ADDE5|nr:PrsW family intramembrane metalloprotease [Acidipropionibacterium jensenii]QCV88261.1 PrsW family intramembrane metalloprotease [Acidipropionibacterium jensenii]
MTTSLRPDGRRLPWYGRFGAPITLVVGVAAYLLILDVMMETQNLNLFPTLLLVGAVTVPAAVLLLAFAVDPPARGHGALIAATAVAGGVVGTTSAGLLEYRALTAMPWLGMVAVGFIEEAVKLILPVLILIFYRKHPRGLGVVLGIASGAGFAVLETMGYGFTALVTTRGDVAAVDSTLLLRALLSPAGHVAWTGMTAWALWRLRDVPRPRHGVRTAIGAYLLAVALHAAWDGAGSSLPVHIAVAVLSVAVLVVLLVASRAPGRPAGR